MDIHDLGDQPQETEALRLVKEALHGDPLAAEALVSRLTPIVQRRVASVWRRSFPWLSASASRQDIEDLCQEILLSLFIGPRHLASWRPERGLDLPRFVDMVTRRRVLSRLQSRRHRPRAHEPTEEDHDLSDPEPDAEHGLLVKAQLREILEKLHRHLSKERWRLFELYFREEKSVEEITDILDSRAPVIHTRLYRLRRTVNKIVRDLSV